MPPLCLPAGGQPRKVRGHSHGALLLAVEVNEAMRRVPCGLSWRRHWVAVLLVELEATADAHGPIIQLYVVKNRGS